MDNLEFGVNNLENSTDYASSLAQDKLRRDDDLKINTTSLDDLVTQQDESIPQGEETLPMRASVDGVSDSVGSTESTSEGEGDEVNVVPSTGVDAETPQDHSTRPISGDEHWVGSDCAVTHETAPKDFESTTLRDSPAEQEPEHEAAEKVDEEEDVEEHPADDGDYEEPIHQEVKQEEVESVQLGEQKSTNEGPAGDVGSPVDQHEDVLENGNSHTPLETASTNGHHEVRILTCAKCGETVNASEGICTMSQTFHISCFKCSKCDCLLTADSFKTESGLPFCEACIANGTPECIKHSYVVTHHEEEMPTPQITKNLVAKFQNPEAISSPAPSGPTFTPGKLSDRAPMTNEDTSPRPSPPRSDEILPPSGAAKRLVEQWSNIQAVESPRTQAKNSSDPHYAPNTAKTIAAKFAAGINETPSKSNGDTNEPDELRPTQGQARGLIEKFSAMQA